MNKVVIFEEDRLTILQGDINRVAKRHRIIDVSIATSQAGFSTYYVATVLYEEDE